MTPQLFSKAKAKNIRSLHLSKYRQKYNKYIAEGHKICKEIIISKTSEIDQIVCTRSYYEGQRNWLSPFSDNIWLIEPKEMKTISTLKTASEVLLVSSMGSFKPKDLLKSGGHIIYLDGIQDPGNLGTILRTADWYGIRKIVVSSDTVSMYNPKVIQAAMGSHLDHIYLCLELQELKELTQLPILGTVLNGSLPDSLDLPESAIVVIGNEGQGIRAQNLELLDHRLTIPGDLQKRAESLNAAITLGIVCHLLN